MDIVRAYKTKLRVSNRECSVLVQCAGAARFVYNWALADRIERYKAGSPTNYYEQKKRFNALKYEEFPWILDLPYTITVSAFRNLDTAYKNFFRRCKQGTKEKGFPKFKSKHNCIRSFTMRDSIKVERDRIRLPVIGWFRLAEKGYLPTSNIHILYVTVSEKAGHWYISLQTRQAVPESDCMFGKPLGIDFGIKTLAACSDGTRFENPRILYKYEKQLARLNRELSRRTKGGQNWKKTKAKIAKLYVKITNTRRYTQHNISHTVTVDKRPRMIVLEDLNVKGMVKNRHLSKAISDASFGELRRQITYKAKWNGIELRLADRFFASSKLCSECGAKKELLKLSERTYCCESCGCVLDRDLNAARNLAALAEPVSNGGLPVELGGHQAPTVKQEVGSVTKVCHA